MKAETLSCELRIHADAAKKGRREKTMDEKKIGAPCADCGRDTEPLKHNNKPDFSRWDVYIVRDWVWVEAGMTGWASGYLCTPCLTKRLGRPLTNADYLCWKVAVNAEGLVMDAHPDYLKHPSMLSQKQAAGSYYLLQE